MVDVLPVSWQGDQGLEERHLAPQGPTVQVRGPCQEQASRHRRRCSDGDVGCSLQDSTFS